MHKIPSAIIWVTLLPMPIGVQAHQTNASAQQTVAALEQTWLISSRTNNPDLIAPLLSERLVSTSSNGKVTDKAAALSDVKNYKWTSLENSDLRVSVFDNTAIATFTVDGVGVNPSGTPITEHERWTDTWLKNSKGKWQCIASHASEIKP